MGTYYGTSASETIDPLDSSNDYIFADAGNDIAYGWFGNDTIDGWTGNDRLYGESGDDYLLGYDGNDSLYGSAGNDSLYGEDDNDILYGDAGNDILNGGTGADEMYGGAGDDTYYVDAVGEFDFDFLQESANAGIDTVISSANFTGLRNNFENITLIGSAYGANGNGLDNVMTGNSSNNRFWGNTGNDSLSGGDGDDILNGYGFGFVDEYDTLTGGNGADTFEIGSFADAYYYEEGLYGADGYAVITDFNWLEGDKIQAHGSASDYNLTTSNWSGTSALDTGIYYQGDLIAVVQDRSGSQILLPNDFNFVS